MPGAFGKRKNKRAGAYGVNGLLGLNGRKSAVSGGGYVESGLPVWVYVVSLMILAGLCVGLYSCL